MLFLIGLDGLLGINIEKVNNMAWTAIIGTTNWEYSTTPETDDPDNAAKYSGNHTNGIRTNSDTTEIYVYCRQVTAIATPKDPAGGFGEINKTALEG